MSAVFWLLRATSWRAMPPIETAAEPAISLVNSEVRPPSIVAS